MTVNIEKYRHHLKSLNLSQEVEVHFLTSLWHFAERVMDVIFGTDPTQLARGLPSGNGSNFAPDPLESKDILHRNFNASAAMFPARKAKP